MPLPITLTIAGAAVLINLWLQLRCGQARGAAKVMVGDGGDPLLIARMRAQANFIENAPFFLILLGLVEFARGPQTWLWFVGILFLIGRLLHPFGMERPAPNPYRMAGIALSTVMLVGLAIYALTIPYMAR